MKIELRLACGALALASVLAAAPAAAFPGGAGLVGVSGNPDVQGGQDCSMSGCHTTFLDDPEFSRIFGPGTVVAGQTGSYYLDIDPASNKPTCGFNLSATGGVLAANDTDTVDEVESTSGRNEIHHSAPITDSGNACGFIQFDWTAPSVGSPITATLYAGTVRASSDGDASNDFSANASFRIAVLPSPPVDEDLLAFVDLLTDADPAVDNLDGPNGIVISADGTNAYVAASDDNALVSFLRNVDTGELNFQTSRVDGAGNPVVDGMRQPVGPAVSSSDFLYVGSALDAEVNTFSRGFAGVPVYDPDGNAPISATANDHTDIALSPDEQVLYVTGDDENQDGLAVLEIDDATGRPMLPVLQGLRSGSSGVGSSEFPGAPQAVVSSPDSRFVYVGGASPSGISVLEREPAALTLAVPLKQFVRDHVDGVHDLGGPDALAMSPSGSHLYAVDTSGDSLSVFRREADGTLVFMQTLVDGDGNATALNGPTDVAVAPNGLVYVTSDQDDAIGVYRPLPGGVLTSVDALFDLDPGVSGLLNARSVTIAAGGRDVYVAGEVDTGSIARFVPEPSSACLGAAVLAALSFTRARRVRRRPA